MNKFVMFGDIVEENGKTIRENNSTIKHNIPIGALVEVKYDNWHGDGACEKIHARLWVVNHTRDCDGTPIYSLGEKPYKTIIRMLEDLYPDLDLMRKDVWWNFAKQLNWIRGTFSEESLTPVEVTEDLKDGCGKLRWEN